MSAAVGIRTVLLMPKPSATPVNRTGPMLNSPWNMPCLRLVSSA